MMRKIKVKDEKPTLEFEGRKFKIISDGTGTGTRIWINDVEQTHIVSMNVKIDIFGVLISMDMFDKIEDKKEQKQSDGE